MDGLELNKACAAVLVAGIAFMGASLLGDGLVSPTRLEKTAYQPALPDTNKAAAPVATTPDPPVELLLASADPGRGEAQTKAQGCVACHSFNQGGKAGVGPNLYGVVGGPHGHMEGYSYSAAIKAKAGPWTFDALNEWLKKPSAYAPGTKMSYAGLTDPKKRADVIDYLRTLAANPEPLPAAPPQAAASQVSPAPAPSIPGTTPTATGAPPAATPATQSAAAPAGGVAPAPAPAGPAASSSAAGPAGGVAPTGNASDSGGPVAPAPKTP